MQFSNETASLLSFLVVVASVTAACEVASSPDDSSGDENSGGGSPEGGTAGSSSAGRPQGGSSGHSGEDSGGSNGARGGSASSGAGGLAATGGGSGSATAGRAGATGGDGQAGNGSEAGHGAEGDGGPGGGGGLGGEGGDPGQGPPEFLYVSRLLGGVLSFRLDPESGAPIELDGSPSDSGRFHYSVAVNPAERFLLALEPDPGHIDTFRIADDGALPETPSSSFAIDVQPITMAFAPDGEFVYVGTLEDPSIRAFTLDSTTGELTAAGDPLVLDTPPAFLTVDPTGRFLYESQEFLGGIRGFRIDANGGLTELAASPFGETLVRAGALALTPDGAFLFGSGRGLNAFVVDRTSGELEPVDGSPFTLDVGSDFFAGNLAIDPQGEFLYATAFTATRHVSGFAIDRTTGVLEAVPGSPLTTSSPYSLGVDPAGRFVYVGNDGGDISAFAIDRRDGSLEELDESPFLPGGLQPGFAFVTR